MPRSASTNFGRWCEKKQRTAGVERLVRGSDGGGGFSDDDDDVDEDGSGRKGDDEKVKSVEGRSIVDLGNADPGRLSSRRGSRGFPTSGVARQDRHVLRSARCCEWLKTRSERRIRSNLGGDDDHDESGSVVDVDVFGGEGDAVEDESDDEGPCSRDEKRGSGGDPHVNPAARVWAT